jgi:hypothetical protein
LPMENVYTELTGRAADIFTRHGLMGETVQVTARVLNTEEAIENPEADDFPLQKGRERLMEATIAGAAYLMGWKRFCDRSR